MRRPTARSTLATLVVLGAPSIGCARPAAPPTNAQAPAAAAGFDELKWKARPIVLIGPSPGDPRIAEARATIAAAQAAYTRRDMALVVVTAADHPLRARFDVPHNAFAAIDSMPMRQSEMRARGEPSPE